MVGDDVEKLKRCLVKLAKPDCRQAPRTRSNHLGNARNVKPVRYDWVIPYFPSGKTQRCVLRLRLVSLQKIGTQSIHVSAAYSI
jgi:hypothetical protein